jgi:integrase
MKKQRGIFEKVADSGEWWIRYVDAGGKYRREKVGAYGLAVKLLDKRRGEAVTGKKLPETLRRKLVPFSEIADDALVYSRAHKRSWRDDESRMKLLVEWFGSRDAESITTAEIERQLSGAAHDEKWAPSTYNHYRALLMLVYREARRAGKVNCNPSRDVRHRHEDNSRVRYLNQYKPLPTEDPYLKQFATEGTRLRAVIERDFEEHSAEFELSAATGLRMGSMYVLTWEMIDWDARTLNIPTSKNGEAIHIPLNNAAMAAVKSALPEKDEQKTGRIFRSKKTGEPLENWRHWFGKAVKTAGIVDFRGHDLRHDFASRLRRRGAKLEDIAELLAHKSLAMTKRYAHLGPNQLHEVAGLLDSSSTTVAPAPKRQETVSSSYLQ